MWKTWISIIQPDWTYLILFYDNVVNCGPIITALLGAYVHTYIHTCTLNRLVLKYMYQFTYTHSHTHTCAYAYTHKMRTHLLIHIKTARV